MPLKFSANLGFLWRGLPLPDAIRRAASAGFGAVECHWPYNESTDCVKRALLETRLPMVSVNTRRGDHRTGEMGVCAWRGRESEAKAYIDEAFDFADAVDAAAVHVMCGNAPRTEDSCSTFEQNLLYASDRARRCGKLVLIEALNQYDAPHYFLRDNEQAAAIIVKLGRTNLRIMFDCYHAQLIRGDVTNQIKKFHSLIGHVQIASVPDRSVSYRPHQLMEGVALGHFGVSTEPFACRSEPHLGELDYRHVIGVLQQYGFTGPIGAEYTPSNPAAPDFQWMKVLQV